MQIGWYAFEVLEDIRTKFFCLKFQGYSCNGLLPLPQMIAMNTEERSRTFPSLVSTQTAVCSLTSVLCWFPKSFIPGGFFAQ
jgi:hypothetical protein